MGQIYGVLNSALQLEFGQTIEKQFDPTVVVEVQPAQRLDGSKLVDFSVEVDDQNFQAIKIKIERSASASGPWVAATIVGTPTVDFGNVPDVNNANPFQVGTVTGVETDEGANTVGLVWDVDADLNLVTTYYLQITVQDTNLDDSTPAVSSGFPIDTISPINVTLTLVVSPPLALLSTASVSATWNDSSPDLNYIRIKVNGGAVVETVGPTNVTSTGTVAANAGVVLYGDDYIQIGARHVDDFGSFTIIDSATTHYVKPATPALVTAVVTGKTTVDVTPHENAADAAGITGFFSHAIFVSGDTNGWVQAGGTIGPGAVHQTIATWGTITVIGLLANHTYEFRSKTRNPNSISVSSDYTSIVEVTTESLDPVVQNVTVTQPTDGTGVYVIEAELQDDYPTITITYEYWDGDSWEAMIAVTGDTGPFFDVPSSPAVKTITLNWNALTQFGIDGVNQTNAKVRVIANDGTGTGQDESVVFDLDTTLPTVDPNTIVTVSEITLTSQRLSWSIVGSDTNFDSYELYFSAISFADALARNGVKWDKVDDAALATNTTDTTVVTGLTIDTSYFVAFFAKDTLGNYSTAILAAFHSGLDAVLRVTAVDQNGYLIPAATVYVYNTLTGVLVTSDVTNSEGYVDAQVFDLSPKFVLIMKAGYGSYVLDDQEPEAVA